MPTEPMLTVAEVLELEPGDEQNATWINPGFRAVAATIKSTKTNAGKPMHICTLRSETGAAEVSMTLFSPTIKFTEGQVIEVFGQGLRRTEYKGMAQVSLGKGTEIHVVGNSVHHGEQEQRKAAGEPAINGQPFPVNGQTVGMAMKEALALLTKDMSPGEISESLKAPTFWAAVHEVASDIIRTSALLEKGKLAKPIKERVEGTPPLKPAPRATTPRTEREEANLSDTPEEDVPF